MSYSLQSLVGKSFHSLQASLCSTAVFAGVVLTIYIVAGCCFLVR